MFYEYVCDRCGKTFEEWQMMDEPHTAKCPGCNIHAQRVFAPARFNIDWVNGGDHGDGLNLGLGKHFKSQAERDYYAAEQGLQKAPSGFDYG